MINVYISKSNDANLDDVIAVRNQLELHQAKVKILEHKGGKYDESLIQKADLVIMIPAKPNTVSAIVGKGLYRQATATTARKTVYCGGRGYFAFEKVNIVDETNWNKYAKLIFGNTKLSLELLLKPSTAAGKEENVLTKKRDYRQLL